MEWWVKEYGPIDKRHMVFGNINLARFRFFSPIFQRSIVPTFQHVCRRFVLHPYGVKSKPGPVGQDSLRFGHLSLRDSVIVSIFEFRIFRLVRVRLWEIDRYRVMRIY
jgi:hypothetical protein